MPDGQVIRALEHAGTELRPSNVHRRVLAPAAIGVGMFVEVEGRDGKPRKRSTVSFHTFRHTCASMLFEEGRNVKQVQEWLGHTDPGFTLRTYVHLMDTGVGDAAFLDSAVGPKDPRAELTSSACDPNRETEAGRRPT